MMRITDAERELMEILWRRGPTGGEELVEQATAAQGWSPKTVRTLVDRLIQKGAVESRRDGKVAIYGALVERETYLRTESQDFLDRLFGGRLTPLVSHFTEQDALTPDELEKLNVLLAKLERKNG
jgi:BlaI family transcriptional regulator, penicillinase repressor